MKKLLLAGIASGALISAANAADMMVPRVYKAAPIAAPAPLFSWTGCHVGGHVGWGWARKDATAQAGGSGGGSLKSITTRIDGNGVLGGAQAGCDLQLGMFGGILSNVVLGFSGSLSAADINGDAPSTPFEKGNGADNKSDITGTDKFHENRIASITGRLGYALGNRGMVYVRGGWAWTHDKFDFGSGACVIVGKKNGAHCKNNGPDVALVAVFIQDRSGWTVGGGIEMPFTFLPQWFGPNWTWFVEYNHYDFGTERQLLTGSGPGKSGGSGATWDIKQEVDTLTTGFNYRFWSGEGLAFGKGVQARY